MDQSYLDNFSDHIVDAYSKCIEVLKDDDVIFNSNFWTSVKKYYALCFFINFNILTYVSYMAKQNPGIAANIFNKWPGILWDFISNDSVFEKSVKYLSRHIDNHVRSQIQGRHDQEPLSVCEKELYRNHIAAKELELEVVKSSAKLREFWCEYFLPDSLTGGGLIILSDKVFAENYRQDTVENIQKKFFTKPIYRARFRAYESKIIKELAEGAQRHNITPQEEFKRRVQSSISEAYGEVQASLLELKIDPSPLRNRVSSVLSISLIGDKYWRNIRDHLPDNDTPKLNAGDYEHSKIETDRFINADQDNRIFETHPDIDLSLANYNLIDRAAKQSLTKESRAEELRLQKEYEIEFGYKMVLPVCVMCDYSLCRHPLGRICGHQQPAKKIHSDYVRGSRRNWSEDILLNHIESKMRFSNLSAQDKRVFESVFLDKKKCSSDVERQAKFRLKKKLSEN